MEFITVRELRTRSGQIWDKLRQRRDLILTSNGKPIAGDGFRSESNFFQAAVDSIMDDMVQKYGLPVMTCKDIDSTMGELLDRMGYLDPARDRGGSNGP